MSRVYWDSMVFVYWLDNHPVYAPRVEYIFNSMKNRGDQLCASYVCVGEVLTGALKHGRVQMAVEIEQFFDSGLAQMLPFDRAAAGAFARLRSSTNVSPADALHLACAAASGVDMFLTNDTRLHKLKVPGIQFIVGLDVNVF